MLKRQVVGRVTAAVIRISRVRSRPPHLNDSVLGRDHLRAVLAEPHLRHGLDHAVHLDQVPGAGDPSQGQPVQLAGRGPEPLG